MNQLSGKSVVVTGATSGIGFDTVKALAKEGAFVIGTGRDEKRCIEALERIRSVLPDAKVAYCAADLSSIKNVRHLAAIIKEALAKQGYQHLDVLINNAGTFTSWFIASADGFELQFAVNHLAPFLLTHELMGLLKAAQNGKIITISSGSHYKARIHWEDMHLRKAYNSLRAYKQSKLANILFTRELNRRLGNSSSVRAYAADPGLVNTEMGLKNTAGIAKWFWAIRKKSGTPPQIAAHALVGLAAMDSGLYKGEHYFKDQKPKKADKYVDRQGVAERLWSESEKMCGIDSKDYGL